MANPSRFTLLEGGDRLPEGSGMWRALGERAHVCRIYDGDESLLESLTTFVGGALWAGESAVVLASDARLLRLETRLRQSGLDLLYLRFAERYLPMPVDALLPRFMIAGRPDGNRFREAMGATLARARRNGDGLRVYDEAVGVLWEQGQYAAAVRLEHQWNQLAEAEPFQLLCAYPRAAFMAGPADAAREIRALHTTVIKG